MSVTRSFSSSWGTCWSGAVKRPDPGGRSRRAGGRESRRRFGYERKLPSAAATLTTEAEQVEQVADGRHVARHVGVVVVLHRIGQIVTTALAQRAAELPVAFDELHERGMFIVHVADVPARREGRHGDYRNARAGAEEINRLDESRVVIPAAFVHRDKNRGRGPQLPVALREPDDVLGKRLERPCVLPATRPGSGRARSADGVRRTPPSGRWR